MPDTKDVPLGTVLSVTTGKLLAPFGDVQELVEWFCDRPVFTHAMPDVADACTILIHQQVPALAQVKAPDGLNTWDAVQAWLERIRQGTTLGATVSITRPPVGSVDAFL
jgi:hypothetical protein